MILYINCQICELKFGLNSLMALQNFSKIYSEEEYRRQLYYLTTSSHLPFETVDSQVDLKNCLFKSFEEAFSPGILTAPITTFEQILEKAQEITGEIDSLITWGVGEMGLPLSDFFKMTPKELDLIYLGFLRRQEDQINKLIVGLYSWENGEKNLVSFSPELGYTTISLSERNDTLSKLNLMKERIL